MNMLIIEGMTHFFATNEGAADILRSQGCQVGKNFRIGRHFECDRNFKCGDNFYCSSGLARFIGDFECGDNFTALGDVCTSRFKFKCGNDFYANTFMINGKFECGDNCRLGDNFMSKLNFKAGNNFKCGEYFSTEGEFICGDNFKCQSYVSLGDKDRVFGNNVKYRTSYDKIVHPTFWEILLILSVVYVLSHILTSIICAIFNIK